MIRKVLLFFLLFYVVNDLHFKWQTGIPALAPVNLLFIAVVLSLRKTKDSVDVGTPILQNALKWYAISLTAAFVWAQVRAFNDIVADLTVLKNAIFYQLFYFLYLHCRQDKKTVRLLIGAVLAIAVLAGLEALREGLDYGFASYNPFKRASGPFGDDWHMANTAGVFFGIFTPMLIAVALFLRRQWIIRIGAVVGTLVIAGGTLFTYSRQAYFIILLSLAILLFRKSIGFAVATALLLVSLIGYLPDTVTQRVEETKQQGKPGGGEEVDASTSSRWELWAGAMDMLAHNPLGVGLARFPREIGSYSSHKGMDAHNFYVRSLAEYGPHGLAALIYLVYGCFRLSGFLRRNADPDDPDARALSLGFTVASVALVFGNVYGSRFLDGPIMGPYWALAGLLERYVHLKKQEGGGGHVEIRILEPSMEERFPLTRFLRR